jgi:hypothetical protein
MYSIGALGVERQLSGEHLVEDHRERVDVAARVERPALGLLRRHELRGPEDHSLLGEDDRAGAHLALGHLRQTEVQHLGEVRDVAHPAEEDVLRLEVPVHDPHLMRLIQGTADGDQDGNRPVDGDGPPLRTVWLRFRPSRYSITM